MQKMEKIFKLSIMKLVRKMTLTLMGWEELLLSLCTCMLNQSLFIKAFWSKLDL